MVGRGALSICCRTGRVGRDRLSLFSFLQGNAKKWLETVKKRTQSWVCNSESVLFYHTLIYNCSKFLSLSSKASFPCLPGTHFLGLTDQSCNPSSPGSHTTTSHIHLLFRCTVLTVLQHFRYCCSQSKALLLWVKIRFPLWLPAGSPTQLGILGPNSCIV